MVIRASRSEGDGGGRGAGRNYLSNRRGNRDRKMGEGRKNYGGEAGIVDGKVICCLLTRVTTKGKMGKRG
jgi:hypothetical protein